MRPADWAWIALAVGVVTWDLLCPDDEMLSQASGRYAKNHPLIAYAVIGSVAAHLVNRIPKRLDPIHGVGAVLRAWKR